MPSFHVPSHAQILVIGGGPAGSYAACALAREGFDVVVFEAAKFPRYHIGESSLPSILPFLKFVGAEEAFRNHGFCAKPGAAIKMVQSKDEGYTDFSLLDPSYGAWNLIRSEFDDLMLKHSAKCGAKVFEETRVTELHFNSTDPKQPITASYRTTSREVSKISFDYVIDASGRAGIISTKYLHNRQFNSSLKNVASWGYWTGCKSYKPGTHRENAIWIEASTDESGWAWYIPLHDGTWSVGIVLNEEFSKQKKATAREVLGRPQTMQEHYLEELKYYPGVINLLGDGELKDRNMPGAIKAASDFSYSATEYAGPHFRLAGDAGCFIDPFFASGIHLALTGGLSAAISVAAVIRGSVSEQRAIDWHNSKVSTSYTMFLLVVLGTYRQMRMQSEAIMHDVDEDSFDRAFSLLRPIIQGTVDVAKDITESELMKTMDFTRHILGLATPEMHEDVAKRIDPKLLNPHAPIMREEEIKKVIDPDDIEALTVLCEINARKVVHPMYSATNNFGEETHVGFNAIIERGRLGLVEAH